MDEEFEKARGWVRGSMQARRRARFALALPSLVVLYGMPPSSVVASRPNYCTAVWRPHVAAAT